eukprot:scaffold95228_cov17-Prasinocladus_malaysianus.AAC.1
MLVEPNTHVVVYGLHKHALPPSSNNARSVAGHTIADSYSLMTGCQLNRHNLQWQSYNDEHTAYIRLGER